MIASSPPNTARTYWRVWLAVSLTCITASCSRNDDSNLWQRKFAAQKESTAYGWNQLNGYWEGDVAMGDIRTKIEPSKITISMKCNGDGSSVAQASAATIVSTEVPPKIILRDNLEAGANDGCGFHFYKGSQFVFTLERRDLLKINFAGTAVSELKKLADLDVGS